jgi:glutamine cyclotransferase
MKPTLGYLILARDIIRDDETKEMSAIRIFDTLFIPKGQRTLTYNLVLLGRVYFNDTGIYPAVQVKVRISDPQGKEIHAEVLTGENIHAEYGMNISARIWLLQFRMEGKYIINTSVSTNKVDFVDTGSVSYFKVEQLH